METEEEITKMMTVPQSAVGWILGKHKAGLQNLKDMSECDITLIDSASVNTGVDEMRIFQIKGLPNKVDIAIKLIQAEASTFKLQEIEKKSKSKSKMQVKKKGNESSESEENKEEEKQIEAEQEIEEEEKFIPFIEDKTKLNIPSNQKVVSLIIGQTGSGKSTFINYLTNFFRKGTLENRKVAIPTRNFPQTEIDFNHTERLVSSDHSQTNNCCAYDFIDDQSSSTFTFIDSPGIGDTRGVEQDDKNIRKIIDGVLNYQQINAIIIVQNGSESRNNATLKYTLKKLRNSLPALMETNIMLVLTSCPISSNFNDASLEIIPKTKILMDNNAFTVENIQNLKENQRNQLQLSWDNSMSQIKELLEFICLMDTVDTKVFQEMIDEVNIAKENFDYAQKYLTNLYSLKKKLEEVREQKGASLQEARAYQNYIKTETVEQIEWVDNPDVHRVCPTYSSSGSSNGIKRIQKKRKVTTKMVTRKYKKPGTCKMCRLNKSDHYHTRRVPVRVVRSVASILNNVRRNIPEKIQKKVQKSVQKIDYDAKAKHERNLERANQLQNQESGFERDIRLVEISIEDTKMKIRTAVQNLRRVAPHYNIAEEIDGVLQQAKQQLKIDSLPKERDKTRIVIRVLEEIYNNLLG
ncbi:unnamed protein product [Blepharisma stoltei]|uniref:K Homology domain-containing protein n=1 Tax=Blepharisma stoltei TaxID=1481888 RepID=A0AAU9IQW4_9CILI|nr:unnamed protein product [Blepharisma stoltei]